MKLFLVFLSLLCSATPLSAQDLTKVDRTILKEPVYQSKQPKYCLLVFGPEAKHRVWLVQDGDLLYVDRNGNGDLTEAGEKVAAAKGEGTNPKEGMYAFEAGDIRDGNLLHKTLRLAVVPLSTWVERDERIKRHVAQHPQAPAYLLGLDVEAPGWKSIGVGGRLLQQTFFMDANGFAAWSDRPATAPIVHFGGPWQLVTLGPPVTLTTGRSTDLTLAVGTPGVGPGSTAYVNYDGVVPEKAYPKVEITYPPIRPGEPPLKELYELKERC